MTDRNRLIEFSTDELAMLCDGLEFLQPDTEGQQLREDLLTEIAVEISNRRQENCQ